MSFAQDSSQGQALTDLGVRAPWVNMYKYVLNGYISSRWDMHITEAWAYRWHDPSTGNRGRLSNWFYFGELLKGHSSLRLAIRTRLQKLWLGERRLSWEMRYSQQGTKSQPRVLARQEQIERTAQGRLLRGNSGWRSRAARARLTWLPTGWQCKSANDFKS